jgi:hypothetical protein
MHENTTYIRTQSANAIAQRIPNTARSVSQIMVHAVALASSSVSLSVVVPPARIIEALDNSIRAELQRGSHSFFICALRSAFVVAVGVILEGPEILHELWPKLFVWFTWKSTQRLHRFERAIKKIAFAGWLLIGIGLFGEGAFGILQNRAEGQMQTFNDILLRVPALPPLRLSSLHKKPQMLPPKREMKPIRRLFQVQTRWYWRKAQQAKSPQPSADLLACNQISETPHNN